MRKSALLAPLAAIAACLALVTPAYASTPLNAGCDTSNGDHGVRATAYYSTPTARHHFWSGTVFTLVGSGGTGGQSNMDIYLYQGSTLIASRHSLDNVVKNYQYKSTEHPRFYLGEYTDGRFAEHVSFKGTFDVFGRDPSCVAVTTNI